MKNSILYLAILTLIGMAGCKKATETTPITPMVLESLDQQLKLEFFLGKADAPAYRLFFKNEVLVDTSYLGFSFTQEPELGPNMQVKNTKTRQSTEDWTTPWGERKIVHDNYRELKVELEELQGKARSLNILFRLYNDGLGIRYEFPMQEGPSTWEITAERTEFKMMGDHTAWWIPADYDSYEHLYHETSISGIDASPLMHNPNLIASSILEAHATNTPVTFKTQEGVYLSISEAALVDYPEMTIRVEDDKRTLCSSLVPSPQGWKAKVKLPFSTPWRTLTVASTPGGLAESDLILNLNEPSKIADLSWIKTGKYMGIWWGMHIDKNTWHQGPKHGATTQNAKELIDFASEHGFPAVLIEGWNTGWENWFDSIGRINAFDWVTPYSDFDLEGVVAYGKSKGVDIIGHHETSSVVYKYDSLMDAAFAQCERLGIPAVKTGYVGKILPKGEYHHGQWMVQHYQRSVETAAKHHVMLDIHEPIKPTGLRRTWPNLMTREGVRGTEFNAWSDGNPPSHLTILPFTRCLAGPVDYTPGIFELSLKPWKPNNSMHSTLCNQLAQYVVLYSPWTMAADLPENYAGNPAFQFIKDVPTDWEESHILDAEIGRYVATARKERGKENWFIGALTNEEGRSLALATDFLNEGMEYTCTWYIDSKITSYDDNPTFFTINQTSVVKGDTLRMYLANGGGAALSLKANPKTP